MSDVWLVLGGAFTGAVGPGAAILFATYGEVLAERAGITNLGVEGCMLMGACFAFITTVESGSPVLGVLAGAAAGGVLALLHAILVIARGTNQIATGLAITLLGFGLTAYVGRGFVGRDIEGLNGIAIPGLADIPKVGEAFFQQDALVYLAYGTGPLLWAVLWHTRWGLVLRAVGESRAVAYAAGHRPGLVQGVAVVLGGVLAGLGGAQLALAYTHTWAEGMVAGRGFIAVALVIFALWNPLRAMVGALLVGGAIALELQLQTVGVRLSPFFLGMLPYVVTLAVLIVWRGAALRVAPAELKGILRPRS
ncbi:MAG: ABC transporter permease [Dehalococcoidia bacterium]|nr:ABC transporter permease [Dehalococcoidia bacterium]